MANWQGLAKRFAGILWIANGKVTCQAFFETDTKYALFGEEVLDFLSLNRNQ